MSQKALVVDNDFFFVEFITELLEQRDYEVTKASDGKEAISKFKSFSTKPDFIIMDYRMPIKHGIDTAKEILKINKTVQIILISGDIGVKERAFRSGAKGFIKKPITIENVIKKIEKLF